MPAIPPLKVDTPQPRDSSGKFAPDKPLVQVTVNNPLTAFRLWLTKLLFNEGVDVRLKIPPLTAIAVVTVLALGGYGLGRITVPASNPIVRYLPQLAPVTQPTPDPWRETAFSGFLRFSPTTRKYYLETASAEAITIEAPLNVNLAQFTRRRIFATGRLNTDTGVLVVTEATDLELLPQQAIHVSTVPVPTATPLPTGSSVPSSNLASPETVNEPQ